MRKIVSLLVLLISVTSAIAQTKQVSGRVISDSSGLPLSGVTVTLKNNKTASTTGSDGRYSIVVPPGSGNVLVFSFVGFASQEVNVGQRTQIDLTLQPTANALNDVVIVGYQSVKRKDLLTASSIVTAKDLKDNPLNNAAEALQGKLAGVQITMAEGMPGSEAIINIRGRGSITQSSEPLYVVDGVPTDNALSILNPQDIESLNVLKDAASTAIYGSRGANGVIVITTKGGKNTNGKTNVTYNTYYGVQQLSQKIDMMGAYDFVDYQFEKAMWMADSSITRYIKSPIVYDSVAYYYKDYPSYDWQERTMGENAPQWSHNLSIWGGGASTTYNLSFTANKQDGILINSGLERKNLNFKLNHKASNRFMFGFNTRYTDQYVWGAGTSDTRGAGSNRLKQYTRYKPIILPGEEEDSYDPTLDLQNAGNGFNILNPILLSEAETRDQYRTQFNVNAYMQIQLAKNFSFRTTVAYNINNNETEAFDDTLTNNAKSNNKLPVVNLSESNSYQITNSNVFTYSNSSLFKSKKSSLSILAGQELQKTTNKAFSQEIKYFPVGITAEKAFANLQLAAASTAAYPQPLASSSEVPVSLLSFFSTADYNYDQRFYAKLTVRADGTSIFGEDNRWGYFPSGAVSWRISNEKFFDSRIINDLRVRYSYGTSGNNRITPFSYKTQYSAPANRGYGLNGALVGIFVPSNLGNEDLRWENQVAQNLGLELSLWKSRLMLTLDVYANKSKDLLLNQTIPSSSGYTNQFQNIGSTENKGVELQLTGSIIQKKNFTYDASFNISFNKNTITSLGPNQQILRNSGWFSSSNFPADYLLRVGEEVGTMYGYVNDGFYSLADFDALPFSNALYPQYNTQYVLKKGIVNNASILANPLQPGSPKFKDLNGDGKIDADNDRTIIGRAQPKYFGGLNQTLAYKGFELNVFLNFVVGNEVFNANKLEYGSAYGSQVNMLSSNNDRWKMIDQQGNSIQRAVTISGTQYILGVDSSSMAAVNGNAKIWFPSTSVNGFYSQSYAVENGSYLRINNVTFAYNFPRTMIAKLRMTNLRVYTTVNNPFIFTNYTGYDPDASTRRSDPTTPGVDYAAYPRARTIVAGLNVTF
ncbi:MAG TPA: TonB-dependent receptor [Phnomibacter sp.]|nr:TonB-dependent receptor [Phnomibacter sp.]